MDDTKEQVLTIDSSQSGNGQDTGNDESQVSAGDAGKSSSGNDEQGTSNAGNDTTASGDTASAAGTGDTVQWLEFTDTDGQTVAKIPVKITGDTVQIEATVAQEIPETYYTDTTQAQTVMATAAVLVTVMLFAVFGALCVRTLIKSFEV